MSEPLRILSAGAAQGVVTRLASVRDFDVQSEFGAVGAMQKKLLDGEACDLIVLTQVLIAQLRAAGRVISSADLGQVATGIAVRDADGVPPMATAAELQSALAAADEIYFPDPAKATAGIHFAKVLEALGIRDNWKTYPNGATAMREMAASRAKTVIGCTQVTEIRNTAGARLVGPLPAPHQLATVYSAGVCAGADNAEGAQRFLRLLSGEDSAGIRRDAGFEL